MTLVVVARLYLKQLLFCFCCAEYLFCQNGWLCLPLCISHSMFDCPQFRCLSQPEFFLTQTKRRRRKKNHPPPTLNRKVIGRGNNETDLASLLVKTFSLLVCFAKDAGMAARSSCLERVAIRRSQSMLLAALAAAQKALADGALAVAGMTTCWDHLRYRWEAYDRIVFVVGSVDSWGKD